MRQYNKSLNKSSRAFREHIAPILKQKWSLDRITPCEGTESPEAQKADYEHCIDYQLFKGGRQCGLANRILFRAEYKGKITLRKSRSNSKPTEFQKLKAAIKNGGIYPEIFCVSCIVGDKVKSCAVVRTSDLMKFISETNPPTFTNYDRDKHQRQEYFCFDLSQMVQKGYRVWILSSCA